MSSLPALSLYLTLSAPAWAAPIEADFRPVARAEGAKVEVARFKQGGQAYVVRCSLGKKNKLDCAIATPGKGGRLDDTGVQSLRKNADGAKVTVVGGGDVSTTIQFKEIKRDIKEKLTYVALDYEDELEKAD